MVDRKQYLFDFRTQEGARAAFFLAANGSHFTFEINDVHGEAHSLDAPVSDEGLKISEPIILVVQLGVSDTATYVQIVADGRDVAHETINFPLDLGSKDWIKHGTIMADRDHKNFAAFSIQYLRVAHATWTKPHYISHTRNVRKLVSDLQKGADHLLANPPPSVPSSSGVLPAHISSSEQWSV